MGSNRVIKVVTAGLVLVAFAACDDGRVTMPGSNTHSRVLQLMSEVRQPDPSGMFPQGIDYETEDQRLGAAAFVFLKGMSRVEAEAALKRDGFVCDGPTCTTMVAERETRAALWTIRHPGPLRTYSATYTVRLVESVVRSPSDLSASTDFF